MVLLPVDAVVISKSHHTFDVLLHYLVKYWHFFHSQWTFDTFFWCPPIISLLAMPVSKIFYLMTEQQEINAFKPFENTKMPQHILQINKSRNLNTI